MDKYVSKINGYLCKDSGARTLLNNVYNKTEIDNKFTSYYTKTASDERYNTKTEISTNYYTKQNIDTKLADYYTKTETNNTFKRKDDIAIVTGTITLTDGVGSVDINYPSGFTKSNCTPCAIGIEIANVYSYGWPFSTYITDLRLNDNNMKLRVNPFDVSVTGTNTYNFKVVLMKA